MAGSLNFLTTNRMSYSRSTTGFVIVLTGGMSLTSGSKHRDRRGIQGHVGEIAGRAADDIPSHRFQSVSRLLSADATRTYNSHAEVISNLIKNTYVPTMQNVQWEGKTFSPPSQIPW